MSRSKWRVLIAPVLLATGWLATLPAAAWAEVKLPNIFGNHMVLQQGQKNKVWGKAAPDEEVTVSIGGQTHKAKGAADGSWSVFLEPLPVGGPHQLKVNKDRKSVV